LIMQLGYGLATSIYVSVIKVSVFVYKHIFFLIIKLSQVYKSALAMAAHIDLWVRARTSSPCQILQVNYFTIRYSKLVHFRYIKISQNYYKTFCLTFHYNRLGVFYTYRNYLRVLQNEVLYYSFY